MSCRSPPVCIVMQCGSLKIEILLFLREKITDIRVDPTYVI